MGMPKCVSFFRLERLDFHRALCFGCVGREVRIRFRIRFCGTRHPDMFMLLGFTSEAVGRVVAPGGRVVAAPGRLVLARGAAPDPEAAARVAPAVAAAAAGCPQAARFLVRLVPRLQP